MVLQQFWEQFLLPRGNIAAPVISLKPDAGKGVPLKVLMDNIDESCSVGHIA